MISPHTPPGTKVVCINATGNLAIKPGPDGRRFGPITGIDEGRDYTVKAIEPCEYDCTGFVVILNEVDRGRNLIKGYSLKRFRRAELPKSLTEILERANTPSKRTERV